MIQVDCFCIAELTQAEYDRLYACASAGRRAKADRCRLPADRLRCIAAGALLQRALGRDDFEVIYNEYGKPRIKDAPDFHYNLSHAGDWVVIACGDGPVGVDVERVDWNDGKARIARRFFAPDEQDYVFGGGGEGSGRRFFEVWTAKESFLKYLGTGLGRSMTSFSVVTGEPGVRFRHLPLAEGYCLTLCADETQERIRQTILRRLP